VRKTRPEGRVLGRRQVALDKHIETSSFRRQVALDKHIETSSFRMLSMCERSSFVCACVRERERERESTRERERDVSVRERS